MAVHLFLGRFVSIVLVVLFGLASVARADPSLTHTEAAPLLAGAAPQVSKTVSREPKKLFEILTYSRIETRRDAVWRKKTAAKLKTLLSKH